MRTKLSSAKIYSECKSFLCRLNSK